MDGTLVLSALALAVAGAVAGPKAQRRLALSRAKHRSLAGHSRWAKRIAGWLPGYAYDETRFFASDDAPAEVVARRRAGFTRLAGHLAQRHVDGRLAPAQRLHRQAGQLVGVGVHRGIQFSQHAQTGFDQRLHLTLQYIRQSLHLT